MPLNLRRLLNHLPIPHGGRGVMYLRSTWHKPTPFDQWRSQAPFRPRTTLRTDHFSRELRRQRLARRLLRAALAVAAVWIVWESVRALL
ncbi:MAG TPA: hypothetical protein VG734_13680 [Lacunisphaera sp.]|nr:hypothetical protein [Lacunisphaera sp.]